MWASQESVSSIIVVDQALALNPCRTSAGPEDFRVEAGLVKKQCRSKKI